MTPALIIAADFVKTGGMDRANYALADYWARQGMELHLVGHAAAPALLAYPNLHWHRVPRPRAHDALGWIPLARVGQRWARRIRRRGGRVVANGGNCDAGGANWVHYVHAAFRSPLAPDAGWLRRAWHRAKHSRALADERLALRHAVLAIANSERTRRDLIEHLHLDAGRIRVVYYGCDPEHFGPVGPAERTAARQRLGWSPERRVGLFVGALGDRRKNLDTVLDAWRRLAAQPGCDMDLVVVGRGAGRHAWRRQAQNAGLGARAEFLGFRRDVPDLLAASDVLIAPARYEAYGLAVHEALAREIPAILSADSGVAERLDAGLRPLTLDQAESGELLADRLRWWNTHGDTLRAPLAATALRIRAHTWDHMAADLTAAMRAAPPQPSAAPPQRSEARR
ncbi:MAG: glycosyltransferase family 4 protein [Terriglobales bacterium]